MGLLTKLLFGTHDIGRGPDTFAALTWLQRMYDCFLQNGKEVLLTEPQSSRMLVYFTLTSTARNSFSVIRSVPQAALLIGDIFREFRLYYECLWQEYLLGKCGNEPSQIDKVKNLYGMVDYETVEALKSLFQDNPRVGKALKCVIQDSYYNKLMEACRDYINTPRSEAENATLLIVKLCAMMSARDITISPSDDLFQSWVHDMSLSTRLKYLRQFDFENCEVIEMPDALCR